jgi:hypothetical protein
VPSSGSPDFTDRVTINIPAGSDWFAFSSVVQNNVSLTAGRQILRLTANGSVNIEDITIGKPISLPGNFSSTRFLNKSPEIRVNEGGYLGNLEEGSFVEYLVNAAQADDYVITLRTATGNNNRQRALSVFSGAQILTSVQVVNGTDWEDFDFAPTVARVFLDAGVQILRFVSTGAVNIEGISVATRNLTDPVVNLQIPAQGYVYNTQAQKPAATVTVGGEELTSGTHYTVTYIDSVNAGTATARIRGVAATPYSALSIDVPYTIAKKEVLFTLKQKEININWGPSMSVNYEITISGSYDELSDAFKVNGRAFSMNDIKVDLGGFGSREEEGSSAPGIYQITLSVDGELTSDNYTAVFDDGLYLVVTDPNENSIKGRIIRDDRHGVIINPNPVTGKSAEIEIRTLAEDALVNIAVYDNVGNLVFTKSDVRTRGNAAKISWDLTNSAGRIVANGSYLVLVEAKGASGKVYRYAAKLGVKR